MPNGEQFVVVANEEANEESVALSFQGTTKWEKVHLWEHFGTNLEPFLQVLKQRWLSCFKQCCLKSLELFPTEPVKPCLLLFVVDLCSLAKLIRNFHIYLYITCHFKQISLFNCASVIFPFFNRILGGCN